MSLIKKSLNLGGHATSVALEPEFWAVIQACARAKGQSLGGFVARIDADRGERPLASALRVFALHNVTHALNLPETDGFATSIS